MYLRRNVVETQRAEMDGRPPAVIYIYEEAQLTKDEALFLLKEQQKSLARSAEDADAMNIDHELRLTLLELGLADI